LQSVDVCDVVLLKEVERPRYEWSLARVTNLSRNDNDIVRTVEVELPNKTRFIRPMNKLVILQKFEK